jgi:hypothetical protein
VKLDGIAFDMSLRTRRFALYAEDGVVRVLQAKAPGAGRTAGFQC